MPDPLPWMTKRQGEQLLQQGRAQIAQGGMLIELQAQANDMMALAAFEKEQQRALAQTLFELDEAMKLVGRVAASSPEEAALLAAVEVHHLRATGLTPHVCADLAGKQLVGAAGDLFTPLALRPSADGYYAMDVVAALRLDREFRARLGARTESLLEERRADYDRAYVRRRNCTRLVIACIVVGWLGVFSSPLLKGAFLLTACCFGVATVLGYAEFQRYPTELGDLPYYESWALSRERFDALGMGPAIAEVRTRFPSIEERLARRVLGHPVAIGQSVSVREGAQSLKATVESQSPGSYEVRLAATGVVRRVRIDQVDLHDSGASRR